MKLACVQLVCVALINGAMICLAAMPQFAGRNQAPSNRTQEFPQPDTNGTMRGSFFQDRNPPGTDPSVNGPLGNTQPGNQTGNGRPGTNRFGADPLVANRQRDDANLTRVVSLEIVGTSRASPVALQQWAEDLSEIGASNVRIRSTGGSVEPGVEETRIGDVISISVTGLVNDRQLQLPGAMFNRGDKARIAEYIQQLKDDGATVALAEKLAFGLTSEQLVAVNDDLKQPVQFSTSGVSVGEVVRGIMPAMNSQFQFDESARAALTGESPVAEQMQGMSSGTALAAAIRPLGLSLVPHREQGGETEYWIVDSQTSTENWPVGWPLSDPVSIVVPKMGEVIKDVEILNVPLSSTLGALEQRIGVPFLYDHNGLARAGVEPDAIQVTLVEESIAHISAMRKLLRQSDPPLKQEVRIDENGRPFVWISTFR